MCFWIFHDWKQLEAWDHYDRDFSIYKICRVGLECRKCGRRKLKQLIPSNAVAPYQEALSWMKEEVLR